MHYYPHNIPDFNNSTRHLTRVERSVYRDAIELYYDTESVLTKDLISLSKKLLCRSEEEKQALKDVIDEFFTETEEGYFHERCDEEIAKYRANTSAKAKAGKASAEARKQKASKRKQKSTGVQQPLNSVEQTNNQELITKNQIKKSKKKELSYDDYPDFCEFWSAYPNKDKKYEALNIWSQSDFPIDNILKALSWQTRCDKWLEGGGKYVPLPTTYLNQKRWQDEPQQRGAAF